MQAVTQPDIMNSVEEVEIKLTKYKMNNKFLSPDCIIIGNLKDSLYVEVSAIIHLINRYLLIVSGCSQKTPIH